jgi:hypothetical protein
MRAYGASRGGCWVIALGLILSACAAPRPAATDTAEQHWDALLAKGDLAALNTELPAAARAAGTVAKPLHWAATRVNAGHGSAGLPVLLAKFAAPSAIRQAASAPGAGEKWDEFEHFAFAYLSYARLVAFIDAPSCGDPSAPHDKLRDLMHNFPDIDRLARQMAPAAIKKVIDTMMTLEAKTWPTRRTEPSRWLCSGGIMEMMDHLAKGGQSVTDVTGQPGQSHYGHQVRVALDPGYQPKFNDPTVWQAQREKRRAAARAVLLKWAGVTP